jgi:hypothetical protein
MSKNIKIFISLLIVYVAFENLGQASVLQRLFALVGILGLFYWWRKELKGWFVDKRDKHKLIREKKLYYVTEKGYLSDLKTRKEVGRAIYYGSNIIFFLIIIVLLTTEKVQIPEVFQWILFTIPFLGIIMSSRFYIPSLFYYSVPLISTIIFFSINDFEHLSSVESIGTFLINSSLFYALLTLILPLHSIRKITNRSWLVGVLISLSISLLLQYIPGNMMKDMYSIVYEYREVTIEAIEKSGASFEFITFLKSNPIVMEILQYVQRNIYDLLKYKNLATASSIFSLVSFLSISSYSLGKILFDLKLRLGEAKAKDIYEKIENQENVDYEDLRDCIFYGGEKYQDKIFSNREYKKTIISTEQGFEFYVEKRNWVIGISHFTQNVVEFLKKLI